jgi:hypothetical protein
MCPHPATTVSSYSYLCVFICPHTSNHGSTYATNVSSVLVCQCVSPRPSLTGVCVCVCVCVRERERERERERNPTGFFSTIAFSNSSTTCTVSSLPRRPQIGFEDPLGIWNAERELLCNKNCDPDELLHLKKAVYILLHTAVATFPTAYMIFLHIAIDSTRCARARLRSRPASPTAGSINEYD